MATYTDGLTAADTDSKEEIFRQLQIAKERLDTISKGPSKGVTVIPKEKKLPKYAGKGDITEWLEDCETTLARFTNEKDKASFLLDHLEGAAKTEVKFQVDIRKATADEMITVLREVYGSHDTWIQLQQQFYSRDQKPGEDFMQYTYSLMDILLELRDKLPEGVKDMDSLLKQRVAEGVVDVTLKRELHRLNEERDKMKFHKFREHAKEWLDSGKKGKKTAIQEEHTTSNELQELRDLVHEQKKRLDEFQCNMHQQQANPQQEFDKEPFTCHYCGGPNHFKRTCIKFQKDQGTFGRGRSTNNGGGRGTFEFQGRGRGQRGFYRGNPRGRGGFRGRGRGDVEAQPTQVGTQEQQTHLNFHQGWAEIPMTHPQH